GGRVHRFVIAPHRFPLADSAKQSTISGECRLRLPLARCVTRLRGPGASSRLTRPPHPGWLALFRADPDGGAIVEGPWVVAKWRCHSSPPPRSICLDTRHPGREPCQRDN